LETLATLVCLSPRLGLELPTVRPFGKQPILG
jgi:hypothetical protein